MRLLVLAAALALSGCMAERMASMIGRPVDDVVATFGIPARVDGVTADTRLYIWTRRANLKPGPAPLSSFHDVASGEFRRVRRLYKMNLACEFQLLARYRPETHRWLVAKVYTPAGLCA